MKNGKQNNQKNNNPVTGLHVISVDTLEDYYLEKAKTEKKLGRSLSEEEATELFLSFVKKTNSLSIYVEGEKGDVKAILSEHFNTLPIKKREDK